MTSSSSVELGDPGASVDPVSAARAALVDLRSNLSESGGESEQGRNIWNSRGRRSVGRTAFGQINSASKLPPNKSRGRCNLFRVNRVVFTL